jgi:Domain of unknown function (DUF4386)
MPIAESNAVNAPDRTSPRRYARICGALYLYIIVAGTFAEVFVRSRLIVPGDTAATAQNIRANETLFRIGFSGELLHLACDVAVAMLLYALLRPVDRNIALLAAWMRLACIVILAMSSLSHFAALRLLGGGESLRSFSPDQLETLAAFALRLHGDGYAISLVFFSFACLALGYLIYRSGYLPKAIGVLLLIAGVCYFVNSFAHFLAPAVGATLFPALFVPIFIAELSLALWLLVKGVDAAKWRARAGDAA